MVQEQSIVISSVDPTTRPGTVPELQFAAVDQFKSAPPIQVTVAAKEGKDITKIILSSKICRIHLSSYVRQPPE